MAIRALHISPDDFLNLCCADLNRHWLLAIATTKVEYLLRNGFPFDKGEVGTEFTETTPNSFHAPERKLSDCSPLVPASIHRRVPLSLSRSLKLPPPATNLSCLTSITLPSVSSMTLTPGVFTQRYLVISPNKRSFPPFSRKCARTLSAIQFNCSSSPPLRTWSGMVTNLHLAPVNAATVTEVGIRRDRSTWM